MNSANMDRPDDTFVHLLARYDQLSGDGIELDVADSDEFIITLLPVRCCEHGTSSATSAGTGLPMFDTSEHLACVAGVQLTLADGKKVSATAVGLTSRQAPPMSYGQVVALGGDFFGDPDRPICLSSDPVAQFAANVTQLLSNSGEIPGILAVADKYEMRPIHGLKPGWEPSGVYASIPSTKLPALMNDEDFEFDVATGGDPLGGKFGRYTKLALTNFDHFGVDAVAAYTAGHTLALQNAVKAASAPDPASKKLLLNYAYIVNAFADHFLTDLFAAGHMRTPRRKLYESASNEVTKAGAGKCAQAMHNEENKFGLWVRNKRGDHWVAYGDGKYRDTVDSANRAVMRAALQQSVDEVWEAFQAASVKPSSAFAALDYVATTVWELTDPISYKKYVFDQSNWSPMFYWEPPNAGPGAGINWRRNDLGNPADRTFCSQGLWPSQWGITTTVAQLAGKYSVAYMPKEQYLRYAPPYPPNERGPRGELGWPAGPAGASGPSRPRTGYGGPDLQNVNWAIAGATGASGPSRAAQDELTTDWSLPTTSSGPSGDET